jgi:hypothetical protein
VLQKTRASVARRGRDGDESNHVNRIPLDMPLEDYEQLPAAVRPLLIRAFSHAAPALARARGAR